MFPVAIAIALTLSAPLHANPPADAVRSGADIVAFRAVADAGLTTQQLFEAYGDFVAAYPRSPLAEVALARCLDLDGDMTAVLDRLAPPERAYLVASFRTHAEILLANPPEGPAVTDAAPAPAPEPKPVSR